MQRVLQKDLAVHASRVCYSTTKPSLNVFPGAYLNRKVVKQRVVDVVRSLNQVPEESIKSNSYFVADFGFDSLARKELYGLFAKEFCVPHVPKEVEENFISIRDVINFYSTHPKAR